MNVASGRLFSSPISIVNVGHLDFGKNAWKGQKKNRKKLRTNKIQIVDQIKDQKCMSFIGPKIWNKIRLNIKTAATTVSFTHSLKKEILEKL